MFKVRRSLPLFRLFFSSRLIHVSVVNSQGSSRANVCCDFMCTTKGSVANQPFPYSDHEAVTAHLRLKARTTADMVSESPNSSAGMLKVKETHHPVKEITLFKALNFLSSFLTFRESGWAGRHSYGGSYWGQSGLALCWEDALHSSAYWGDGIGFALPGAGHRRGVLVGPGHRSALPPRLVLHAGRVVRCHPADHLSALRVLHHGAEISSGNRRPDEADCWQPAGQAQGPSLGWARRRGS